MCTSGGDDRSNKSCQGGLGTGGGGEVAAINPGLAALDTQVNLQATHDQSGPKGLDPGANIPGECTVGAHGDGELAPVPRAGVARKSSGSCNICQTTLSAKDSLPRHWVRHINNSLQDLTHNQLQSLAENLKSYTLYRCNCGRFERDRRAYEAHQIRHKGPVDRSAYLTGPFGVLGPGVVSTSLLSVAADFGTNDEANTIHTRMKRSREDESAGDGGSKRTIWRSASTAPFRSTGTQTENEEIPAGATNDDAMKNNNSGRKPDNGTNENGEEQPTGKDTPSSPFWADEQGKQVIDR